MNINLSWRRAALAATATAIALATSSCSGSSLSEESGDDGTVEIGLLVSLSGTTAPVGEEQKRGFELYLEQHDGKLGGQDIEVVEADEGSTPSSGVAAAQRLIRQDKVDAVVGLTGSSVALGARDLFVKEKVPVIVTCAGANDVTDAETSPYVWRTSLANRQTGASIGKYLAEQTKDGSVYVMAADYAAGHETADAFKETFEAAGGKTAGEAYTPFGTTQDFQPYLSKIKSSDATAVFAWYAGGESVLLVKQYADFGLNDDLPLYGGGNLNDGLLEAEGPAALGVQTTLNYSSELDTPENEAFVAAYEEAYDATPTAYAVQSYDAAAMLDQALANIDGDITAETISEALDAVETVESPRGDFAMGDDHNPEQAFYLRRVEEGDNGLVNTVVADLGVVGTDG